MKKLIVFDLDGTLTKSKQPLDPEMAELLCLLLSRKEIAIISGCSYRQFQDQFLEYLDCSNDQFQNLFLFPTCSTQGYRYRLNNWTDVYKEGLTRQQKDKIWKAVVSTCRPGFATWGKVIEDRETQITYSALGQEAPLEEKQQYDPDQKKRKKMKKELDKLLPEFEVRIGGTTSIDITKKGIDKAYGLKRIMKSFEYKKSDVIFIGDALYEGGNDHPVKKLGIQCIEVSGPEETKRIIKDLIKFLK